MKRGRATFEMDHPGRQLCRMHKPEKNSREVDSELRIAEHNARGTPTPPMLLREPSSAKEAGGEDRNISDKSPRSLEQDKDQPKSALDSSKPEPNRTQALPFVIIGISLSVFLVSLDRTIITTVSFLVRLRHLDIGDDF